MTTDLVSSDRGRACGALIAARPFSSPNTHLNQQLQHLKLALLMKIKARCSANGKSSPTWDVRHCRQKLWQQDVMTGSSATSLQSPHKLLSGCSKVLRRAHRTDSSNSLIAKTSSSLNGPVGLLCRAPLASLPHSYNEVELNNFCEG